MSQSPKPSLKTTVFGSPLSVAGVIGLLADVVGLGAVAIAVVFGGQTVGIWERFVILVALFVAALGLLLLGARGAKVDSATKVIRFYTYVYAILAAVTYACIAWVLATGEYTMDVYIGFWIIMVALLVAFGVLRFVSKTEDQGWFSVPMGTATIWHFVLLVAVYVVMNNPIDRSRLLQNLVFAIAMLVVSSVMYAMSELPGSRRSREVQRTTLR